MQGSDSAAQTLLPQAGLQSGAPPPLLPKSLLGAPKVPTQQDPEREQRLSEPACPLLMGPRLPGWAEIPGSCFQPHPRQAQVENITMVTLVSEGQPVASGKNDTSAPSTWSSLGLQNEFHWHDSQLAQRLHFMALHPWCGLQDTGDRVCLLLRTRRREVQACHWHWL